MRRFLIIGFWVTVLGTLAFLIVSKYEKIALIPTDAAGWQAAAERLRQRYAVEPLTYTPSTTQHPEVVAFLPAPRARSTEDYYAEISRGR